MRDEKIVLEALKAYRNISLSFRRGGMEENYKQAKEALEAFERIINAKMVDTARV